MHRFAKLPLALLVVSALASAGEAPPASAEKRTVDRQEDLLPSNNLFSKAEIAKDFVNGRIKPYNNPKLYFEIGIPKTWGSKPLQVGPEVLKDDAHQLVPMARIEPNVNPDDAAIEVSYVRAPPDATPAVFVQKFASAAHLTFVLKQQGEFNNRQVFDALLEGQGSHGPVYLRMTASRRDEYIFVVASFVLKSKYDKYKKVFGLAAVSFDPSGKPGR